MAYKIEITGDNIQTVYQGMVELFTVMVQGGNNAFRAPATPQPEQPVAPPVEQIPDEAVEVIAPAEKRKPGRPPKPVVIEAKATDSGFASVEQAIMTTDVSKPEVVDFDLGPATKTLTLKDDIQPRVREIVDNYKARNPKVEEKAAMQGAVNYAVALLAKFGVKKATDLTPDQFADFMAQSEAYVTGDAI